jgi:adenylate kinase family enzyme
MAHPLAPREVGRRISVVGTCGSGKTTTASALAQRLGLRHVELDALAWGPDWSQRPDDELRAAVTDAVAGEGWVIDGNYGKTRDLVWASADTVVWLDYRFPRVFTRLLQRTFRRTLRREILWHGNRERLRMAFLSRDSILLWALKTHWRRQREYTALLARPQHQRLQVVRLRSPRETAAWLEAIQQGDPSNVDIASRS